MFKIDLLEWDPYALSSFLLLPTMEYWDLFLQSQVAKTDVNSEIPLLPPKGSGVISRFHEETGS